MTGGIAKNQWQMLGAMHGVASTLELKEFDMWKRNTAQDNEIMNLISWDIFTYVALVVYPEATEDVIFCIWPDLLIF